MKRKITVLTLCAILFALCGSVDAQQTKKIPTVGFLLEGFPSSISDSIRIDAFRKGLHEIGYTEGKSIFIEYRFAEGKRERLSDLASELVRLKPDVIVTYGTVGAVALKQATTTIPIVTVSSGDPVGRGLVASLGSARRKHYRTQRRQPGFKRETVGTIKGGHSQTRPCSRSLERLWR